jgi:hypothetical protein
VRENLLCETAGGDRRREEVSKNTIDGKVIKTRNMRSQAKYVSGFTG